MIILSLIFLPCFFMVIEPMSITVPKPSETAAMARFVVHESDWISIATISTLKKIKKYPFVSLISMSDGMKANGTGIPYLYMTDLDMPGQDTEVDNRITVLATLAQSDYCKELFYDPQDPRCARVMLTGRLVKIPKSDSECEFAKRALFSRHPSMTTWPSDHGFYFAKVDLEQILLFDQVGGPKDVSVKDYFSVNSIQEKENSLKIIFEENIAVFNVLKLNP